MTNDELRNINRELNRILPRKGKLAKAMRYSVLAGGKRFRPQLCLLTAKVLGGRPKKVLPFACAVEMIHTFTLVHDDLPAMDNSDLRRGQPTCHKAFGEGVAILAGDALSTLAFKLIARYPTAVEELSRALLEVVEGQVADLESANRQPTLAELRHIHGWKTAALLKACVRGTAKICGATPGEIRALTAYAKHLGLAFQIADDILDATASEAELGKPVRADEKKGYVYLVGLDRSRRMAATEKDQAIKALRIFRGKAAPLVELAEFVLIRKK
ncbi:MAG: polyprenyl synthetase family protein [Candidatus Margulisiibacteriota bacterium]